MPLFCVAPYFLRHEVMNVSNIYVTGIISPIKRKSLPEIAKVVGINSYQSLHHFIAKSPWSGLQLKKRRLTLTKEALKEQKITVVIDETGDRKKRCDPAGRVRRKGTRIKTRNKNRLCSATIPGKCRQNR